VGSSQEGVFSDTDFLGDVVYGLLEGQSLALEAYSITDRGFFAQFHVNDPKRGIPTEFMIRANNHKGKVNRCAYAFSMFAPRGIIDRNEPAYVAGCKMSTWIGILDENDYDPSNGPKLPKGKHEVLKYLWTNEDAGNQIAIRYEKWSHAIIGNDEQLEY
jgi:hypothetical protein